jgi:glycosyltransferase involved in cell wall biosynthesis
MTCSTAWRSLADSQQHGLSVLHITEAPLGGVLTHLHDVVAGQAASAEVSEIHVLVPEVNASAIESIASDKVVLHLFRCRRGSIAGVLRLALETVRLTRRARPDIVHIHSTVAGIVSRLALLCLPRRPLIVYCAHGWPLKSIPGGWPFLRRLECILGIITDTIICVSHADREVALKCGIKAAKCVVVMNGIAEGSASDGKPIGTSQPPGERRRILFVGRFDFSKGFDIYLDIMGRLQGFADGLVAGGYIVGKPQKLDIPPNVTLFGWCPPDRLQQLYQSADLIIMPSRTEGLPLVALEAMRAKRAVFASAVGGLPEVVMDDITGRLLDFREPESVARLIREVTLETLARYGTQGFARFHAEFTASHMNARLIDQYRAIFYARRKSDVAIYDVRGALP